MQPICLGGFVSYFAQRTDDDDDVSLSDAYLYASGIICSAAFLTLTYSPFILYMCNTSYKIRLACSGLIYQKALRITRASTAEGQTGTIINLLSNDLAKFHDGLSFVFDVWRGPFEALVFFIVIYMEIGTAAFAGYAFLASFIPLKGMHDGSESKDFKLHRSFGFSVVWQKSGSTACEKIDSNRLPNKNYE